MTAPVTARAHWRRRVRLLRCYAMDTRHWIRLRVLACTLALIAPLFGCESKEAPARAHPTPEPPRSEPAPEVSKTTPARGPLLRVEAQKVCMINDRFMSAPQIPVVVEGKTYYGCCPMCERRLRDEPASRFGVDPVSKKRVDKAAAVIGKLESGAVLYFESEQTFGAFTQKT